MQNPVQKNGTDTADHEKFLRQYRAAYWERRAETKMAARYCTMPLMTKFLRRYKVSDGAGIVRI